MDARQKLRVKLAAMAGTRRRKPRTKKPTPPVEQKQEQGRMNPNELMDRMGLTDPATQASIIGKIKSGELGNMNKLLTHIKALASK